MDASCNSAWEGPALTQSWCREAIEQIRSLADVRSDTAAPIIVTVGATAFNATSRSLVIMRAMRRPDAVVTYRTSAHRKASARQIADPAAFVVLTFGAYSICAQGLKGHVVREPREGATHNLEQLLRLEEKNADHDEISVHGQYGRR
jgi:hypothetical protein